jgi:hypothetical protein
MSKSLNQLYKESGTTLSYKEWRRREDEKMASFDGVKSPIDSLKNDANYLKTIDKMQKTSGYKNEISGNTIFGINKYALIVGGLIIVGAIAYKIYQKRK